MGVVENAGAGATDSVLGDMTSTKPAKNVRRMGPIRDNLEAFGVAILAAVLLKWFCIEAYQIPTSSMQPTLMGSTEASVYDRILVDKIYHSFFEPARWDVTVFRYPLQRNQSYVKRIVGVGGEAGEKLTIAGGNLYQVEDRDGKREYTILRKPANIRDDLWKNVFPARQQIRSKSKAIGDCLFAAPGTAWSEADGVFTGTLSGDQTLRLAYNSGEDSGGFVDRVWDGYPLSVATAIWEKHKNAVHSGEIVPDARITATLQPEQALQEVTLAIDVLRPGHDKLTYAFELRGDQGKLVVRSKDTQVLAESAAFACAVTAGGATEIAFARLDDMLFAWREGTELATLDVAPWHTREGCVLAGTLSASASHAAVPMLTVKGSRGKVVVTGLRMDRDLHYTRAGAPEVVEVPANHFFMMGDNTLQSVDSRDWTSITIGVLPDGTIVPPETPGARTVRGNKRPVRPDQKVDRDETPVIVQDRGQVMMLDDNGEVLALRGRVAPSFLDPQGDLAFTVELDGKTSEFRPPTGKVPFVPRGDVVGRALLAFWPTWPFGPQRIGFIR